MSMAEIISIYKPNPDDMRSHIEFLFGGNIHGFQDGLIELAWTDAKPNSAGLHPLRHARLFGTDQIDELIEEACRVNANAKTNVYIGAALRHPGTAPFGRAQDADFFAATAVWADFDDEKSNSEAKRKFEHCPPSFVVCTGKYPHARHQTWWRLAEPVTEAEDLVSALRGISRALDSDTTVTNPSRVMRLAGSIAWDIKEGRVPEVTSVVRLKNPGRPLYHAEEISLAFPAQSAIDIFSPSDRKSDPPGPDVGIVRERNTLGLETNVVVDGREKHMRNVVCAALLDIIGRTGLTPSVADLFDEAWPTYESTTDLSRSGRGRAEFMMKCRSTLHRFSGGRIKGMRSVEEARQTYNVKKNPVWHATLTEDLDAEFSQLPRSSGAQPTFEILDIRAIKNMADPKWLVKGLVTDLGMGFVFGPPGCGKSFITISMALSVAAGAETWWGRDIERSGPVIYISSEGQSDMKFRIRAWEAETGVKTDDLPFYLIRQPMNFMSEADVVTLLRTIQIVADSHAAPCMVVVDTVSRVLPGADENLQKDMTLFIRACDLVRERFGATVVGVHHTSRQGNMRGSTVFDGAGDFLAQIEREEGAETGYLIAKKIKAAEDGWKQVFKLKKVELGLGKSSLYASPADKGPNEPKSEWPDLEICRRVISLIRHEWDRGRPLSSYPQTRLQGRYAPDVIQSQIGVNRKLAEKMVLKWLNEEILSVDIYDKESKQRGLRVVTNL